MTPDGDGGATGVFKLPVSRMINKKTHTLNRQAIVGTRYVMSAIHTRRAHRCNNVTDAKGRRGRPTKPPFNTRRAITLIWESGSVEWSGEVWMSYGGDGK